jgi:predicted adenine nucleotide alpha hydrolase (AANH) superfamily ATPase
LIILRILVHVCCAPCFSSVHKTLSDEGREVVGFFFNPNIHPYQEFQKRLHCLERYSALRPVEVIYDKEYNLDSFLVGALKAKYDSSQGHKIITKPKQTQGGLVEKIEVKDHLQIQLTPKDNSMATTRNIEVENPSTRSSDIRGQKNNADFKPRCGYCISLRLAKTAELAVKDGFDAFTTTLLESKYQPHDYIRTVGTKLAAKHGIKFYYKDFRTGWKESIKISKELELYRQQYCGCIFSEYERFGPE